MKHEIERKFIITKPFDLGDLIPLHYERYILFKNEEVELRVQMKSKEGSKDGTKHEFERKVNISELERENKKFLITESEFEFFKNQTDKQIIRDGYFLAEGHTQYSLKVYKGQFEGLIRVEIEFTSEEEANEFKPFEWLGAEITDSVLGRDGTLVDLSKQEFLIELSKYH